MYAIGIGYPLGVKNNRYIIQIKSNTYELYKEELDIWLNIEKTVNEENFVDNELSTKLLNVGAISIGGSKQEVFEKVLWCKSFRQGVGAIYDNKYAVFIGSTKYFLTKTQYEIWIRSDNIYSLEEIYKSVKNEINITDIDFYGELYDMVDKGMIFIV